MNAVTLNDRSWAIVADADRIPAPDASLFDADHWRARGAVVGEAAGRGHALMLDTPFGAAVLRPYLRGGQAARLSRDRYLWLGLERTRAVHEFRVLAGLRDLQLPVPAPLAAGVRRSGLVYRCALLMERIQDARPLGERLGEDGVPWPAIGRCICRFHEAGLDHADLNARNILLAEDGTVWLIDFDRARFDPLMSVNGRANLRRLHRSLAKLWPDDDDRLDAAWEQLLKGYRSG
ncbi:MAG: 3-deoxy-D-manno-octulosonic acid kinase [Xanthomonadales bacterium]|nr:3-deoxy-D-manno-octulosonic acid kinase [Xanthomonadales bacterium]